MEEPVYKNRYQKYYQTHKKECNLRTVKSRQTPKAKDIRNKKARDSRLAYYGITEKDFQMIMEEQGGVCAICGRPPTGRSLDVDHEHQRQEKKRSPESRKKRIRGLLCHRCNRALGLFGNNLELLLLASKNFAEYIEKYYTKRLIDEVGIDEAKKIMGNTVTYLEKFEKKLQDNK